ncbi:MAG: 5-oxoprolinase subunit PxpB [Desulfosporosinus sp.]|nr:5-oxoprolinase subunit PxpB [Desulfosporosinus sp.]
MFKLTPLGDCAIQVQFGDEIDNAVFEQVQVFLAKILHTQDQRVLDVVPAYTSVTIFYKPGIHYAQIAEWARALDSGELLKNHIFTSPRIVEIPVCYGGEFGPDLDYIASYHRLSVTEVINKHTTPLYRVYMIGFMPGFPYLGGLDPELTTPRLSSPRALVPMGSVGIAGGQTGVYPLESPGGWQLLGRTPKKMFNIRANPPTLLQSGDRVRFVAINEQEFCELEENSL